MKVKERVIRDLDTLDPTDMVKVYDLILSLKRKGKSEAKRTPSPLRGYLRAQKALEPCHGSLSDDVVADRGDRI